MQAHHWYTLISYTALCYIINAFAVYKVMTNYKAQEWYSDKYWNRICNFIWIFVYSPFSAPIIVASYFVNRYKRSKDEYKHMYSKDI